MTKVQNKLASSLALEKDLRIVLLAIGFAAAVYVRVQVGGVGVASSAFAGFIFGCCLMLLTVTKIPKIVISLRTLVAGVLGGLLLTLPIILRQAISPELHKPAGSFLIWSLVVAFVALAEEAFLRGTFFNAVAELQHDTVAVVVAAIAFAALHVPLYGWHVVPLDFFVGLLLGQLRMATNSFIAPGIAHTLADLVSWWLR